MTDNAHSARRIVDILDEPVADQAMRWSRVNAAEQFPGVVSTLTWDLWRPAAEFAGRQIFRAMGLLGRRELGVPDAPEQRFVSIRHGRQVANVAVLATVMDRMPGMSGDDFEEQILGERPLAGLRRPERKRRFSVLARMPVALLRSGRILDRETAGIFAWRAAWLERIAREGEPAAKAALHDVVARLPDICAKTGLAAFVQQAVFAALQGMLPEEKRQMMFELSSGKGLLETEFAQAVWAAANGQTSRENVIARFGHFGVDSADCARPSIRDRPQLLDELLETYRGTPAPDAARQNGEGKRSALESAIMGAIPSWKRPAGRWLLRACHRLAEAREKGRSGWMQALDVARAAARTIGKARTVEGALRDDQDAFHLTVAELVDGDTGGLDAAVAYRKGLQGWREGFDLAISFTGEPDLLPLAVHDAAAGTPNGEALHGMPASAGRVRGRARVVLNPFKTAGFLRGDILVCRFTDPNWTPLMALSGGVVADIGGALSHGAIIARELGIPAVVNTRFGTSAIPDGAEIEIDGSTGEITIFDTLPEAA